MPKPTVAGMASFDAGDPTSTVASLARAAADAAAEADAARDPAEAIRCHERAARAYVTAAKRVRGPPRTALLAIGEGHARRAGELQRPVAPAVLDEHKDRPASKAEPPPGTLCVGDLLALERRLHALGARETTVPEVAEAPRPVKTSADITTAADRRVSELLGEAWAAAASDEEEEEAPAAAEDDARLARTVARLAAANAQLVEERDALKRDARRVQDTRAATEALAKRYDVKFGKLRESLDAFRRAYPAPANPANVLEPGAPAPSLDDLERDARELRAQLAAERDLGRKRDAIIARYEHWYQALKESAAARRRPSHEGSFEA